jgi:hypothetical protein
LISAGGSCGHGSNLEALPQIYADFWIDFCGWELWGWFEFRSFATDLHRFTQIFGSISAVGWWMDEGWTLRREVYLLHSA